MADKIFGIEVSKLPPLFLSKITEDGLASDGYWKTFASDHVEAEKRIRDFVKLITKETIGDFEVMVISKTKKACLLYTSDAADE